MKITAEQLTKITGKKTLDKFVDPLNACLEKYSINTPLRICHFLAQMLHESGCFVFLKELASGKEYEGRHDLGNIQEGDGVRYKGRGLIQITGRANYAKLGVDLGVDFLHNPELLEWLPYAVISAGWFWDLKKLNACADIDDFKTITKRINGGFNGYEDRLMWLNKCKQVIK